MKNKLSLFIPPKAKLAKVDQLLFDAWFDACVYEPYLKVSQRISIERARQLVEDIKRKPKNGLAIFTDGSKDTVYEPETAAQTLHYFIDRKWHNKK